MRQQYRGHYQCNEIGISEFDANKNICLFAKKFGEHEVEFWASVQQLKEWHSLLVQVLMDFVSAGKTVGKKT
jgi:hypothetical protein